MGLPAIIKNGKIYGHVNLGRLDKNEATEAVRVRGEIDVISWWSNPKLKTIDRGRLLKELYDRYKDEPLEQPSLF